MSNEKGKYGNIQILIMVILTILLLAVLSMSYMVYSNSKATEEAIDKIEKSTLELKEYVYEIKQAAIDIKSKNQEDSYIIAEKNKERVETYEDIRKKYLVVNTDDNNISGINNGLHKEN